MNKQTFPIALANEVCRVCGKSEAGPIIIKTKAVTKDGPAEKEFMEKVHGKNIGFMKEPCAECQENMKKCILLVGIDMGKTDFLPNGNIKDTPYRTGKIVGMSEAWVKQVIKPATQVERLLKDRWTFIDGRVVDEILEHQKQAV